MNCPHLPFVNVAAANAAGLDLDQDFILTNSRDWLRSNHKPGVSPDLAPEIGELAVEVFRPQF
jgi:hypothetical protein